MTTEQVVIGCCLLDPACIDQAIQGRLTPAAFQSPLGAVFGAMIELRCANQGTDFASIAVHMGKDCPMQDIMDTERVPTTSAFAKALEALVWSHKASQLKPALEDAINAILDEEPAAEVRAKIENVSALATDDRRQAADLKTVTLEAIRDAEEAVKGLKRSEVTIGTGLPTFDSRAGFIYPHEYVILGAVTSHGKSSILTNIMSYNEARGLRIAYFTLETSAKSVVQQLAAQRSGANRRAIRDGIELKDRYTKYMEELRKIEASKNILIFDDDCALDSIQSRCRLLKASFQPHAVLIDYLGLISVDAPNAKERLGRISKAMIPLRKSLGCALIVAAQFSRELEKDDRQPVKTDFRDNGEIEQDAHRILALYRPGKDFNGMPQDYNRTIFDYEILQLKCRDGALTASRCKFSAPSANFFE